MNEQVKQFIEENINLIDEDTKKSWEKIYSDLYRFPGLREEYIGQFTQTMLFTGIDPTYKLQQIPDYYLFSSDIESYNIHNQIISIGRKSFRKCSNLKFIHIPDSVTKIDSAAFDQCKNLYFVSIPNQIEYFGKALFWNCPKLESIEYRGTINEAKEQIDKYKLSKDFTFGGAVKKLICTDGVIDL